MSLSVVKLPGGEIVGDYRILEELGRGGMGRVFRVEHTITKRLEAMKVLEDSRFDTPAQSAGALREIQVLARLEHPNIVSVHNAFCVNGVLVLVMELIDGRSLRQIMDGGRIPLETALDYTRLILGALNHAHEHSVIHRDVSPANIMVSSSGVLKLTDFGLARGPGDVKISASGAPIGSPHYMSPEQVQGTTPADARSDIYSVGVLLYELATGKKPFDGESAFSVMMEQVNKAPAPPVELEPSLPDSLNGIILRALEKDPARRFQSANEFREALTGLGGCETGIQKASAAGLRRWWIAWAATIVCLAGLVMAIRLIVQPRSIQPVEQKSIAINTTDPRPVSTNLTTNTQKSAPAKPRGSSSLGRAETPSQSKPNPLKRALGSAWRFVRRKKSPSKENDPSATLHATDQ